MRDRERHSLRFLCLRILNKEKPEGQVMADLLPVIDAGKRWYGHAAQSFLSGAGNRESGKRRK